MRLIYNGTHDEVEVPAVGIVATRGVPVEVEDEAAEALLRQDVWSRAKAAPAKATKENK